MLVFVPAGKLTTEQLRSGYVALAKIDELIANGKMGQDLTMACNEYYTRIPHYFGCVDRRSFSFLFVFFNHFTKLFQTSSSFLNARLPWGLRPDHMYMEKPRFVYVSRRRPHLVIGYLDDG